MPFYLAYYGIVIIFPVDRCCQQTPEKRTAQNRMPDILCLSAVELNCHPKTIKNTSVHLDS